MDEGLDLRIWLTLLGVFVAFFALPFVVLERHRRKRERDDA